MFFTVDKEIYQQFFCFEEKNSICKNFQNVNDISNNVMYNY